MNAKKIFGAILILFLLLFLLCDVFSEREAFLIQSFHDGCSGPAKTGTENIGKVKNDSAKVEIYNEGKNLIVTHKNSEFNCCIDTILVKLIQKNNFIKLIETEVLDNGGCDCICPYEVKTIIKVPDFGIYTIEIWVNGEYEGEKIVWRSEVDIKR